MSRGSAAAFVLKIVLGVKQFALYIAFAVVFSLVTGLAVNFVL